MHSFFERYNWSPKTSFWYSVRNDMITQFGFWILKLECTIIERVAFETTTHRKKNTHLSTFLTSSSLKQSITA